MAGETVEQSRVAAVVWPWRAGDGGGSPVPPAREHLRALAQGVLLWAGALVAELFFRARGVAVGLLVAGCGVAALGLLWPPAYRAVTRAAARVGQAAGTGMTWLVLVPFFYTVVLGMRGVLALRGRDPLHQAFPTDAPTYWVDRGPDRSAGSYRKQF